MAFLDEVRKHMRILRVQLRLTTTDNPGVTELGDRRWGKAADNLGPIPIKGTVKSFGSLTKSILNFDQDLEIPTITTELIDRGNEWKILQSRPWLIFNRWFVFAIRVIDDNGNGLDACIARAQLKEIDNPAVGGVRLSLQVFPGSVLGTKIPRRVINTIDHPRSAEVGSAGLTVPVIVGNTKKPTSNSAGRVLGGAVQAIKVSVGVPQKYDLKREAPQQLHNPSIRVIQGEFDPPWGGSGADNMPAFEPFYLWVTWVGKDGIESRPTEVNATGDPGSLGWTARITWSTRGGEAFQADYGTKRDYFRIYIANAPDFHPFNGMGSATIARVKNITDATPNNNEKSPGEEDDDWRGFWGSLSEGEDYSVAFATGALGSRSDYVLAGHACQGVDQVYEEKQSALEITSLTLVGTLATAVTSSEHNYTTGQDVVVAGADQAPYNQATPIQVISPNSFTYQVGGSPASPATGIIRVISAEEGHVLLTEGTDYEHVHVVRNGNSYHELSFAEDKGAARITANVRGAERNADTTGVLIEKAGEAFFWLLNNWYLNDYKTGPYFNASPSILMQSFLDADTVAAARIPGGYISAGVLSSPTEVTILLKEWVTTFGFDFFINDDEMFEIYLFNPQLYDRDTLPSYTMKDSIFRQSFSSKPDFSRLANHLDYLAGPQLGGGYLYSSYAADSDLQALYGTTGAPLVIKRPSPVIMAWTLDTATADNVASWYLRMLKNPPIKATFATGLRAKNYPINSVVSVTHEDGIANVSTGWDRRVCQVIRTADEFDRAIVRQELLDLDFFFQSLGLAFWMDRNATSAEKTYTTASEANKGVYMYWADRTTGQFSNGDSAKRWT